MECYTDDEDDEDEDEGASETQKDEGHLATKKGFVLLSDKLIEAIRVCMAFSIPLGEIRIHPHMTLILCTVRPIIHD